MRVLLLTQWFDPEPTFKGLAFAKELQAQGCDVSVLTGFPNYPGGKIYNGYKIKLYQKEEIDGVSILRVPLYPSHDSSALKRILNYISFAFMAMLFGIFYMKKVDVMYAYHPPLTVGIAAIMIKFFRRVPVVYDIQDMWPDTLKSTGMLNNERLLNIISKICQFVYKNVDHIVVLSPGFKKLLVERNLPANKISIIYNWCDEQKLLYAEPIKSEYENIMNNKFNIVFAGNMGKAQALDTILDVAHKLLLLNHNIQFVMVGNGTEIDHLKQRCQIENLTNIVFFPQMPMSEIGGILQKADALLVHLKKDLLFEITIPSKTQAYMAIGKPILMGVGGDASNLIQQANCGECFISEDTESMLKSILAISILNTEQLSKLSYNAKNYYQNYLSIKSGVFNFIDIFKKVKK